MTPLAALALALAGDVIDVDAVAGPIHEIRDAVSIASDGDLIRVYPGTYGYFGILDKDLSVVATSTGVLVDGLIRVQGLTAGKTVLLSGLRVEGADQEALLVATCEGAVRVDDCEFMGPLSWSFGSSPGSAASVRVLASDDVAFGGCRLRGADLTHTVVYNVGVRVEGSRVHFHSCEIAGGSGNPSSLSGIGDGARGAELVNSTTTCIDSSIRGGDAWAAFPAIPVCSNLADGGHGARVFGGVLYHRHTTFAGGRGGDPGCSSSGNQGLPIESFGSATVTPLPGSRVTLLAGDRLVREGQPARFRFYLAAAGRVDAIVSLHAGQIVLPGLGGALLVAPPLLRSRYVLGSTMSAGVLVWDYTLPSTGVNEHVRLEFQAAHVSPLGGISLGPRWSLIVVDAAVW